MLRNDLISMCRAGCGLGGDSREVREEAEVLRFVAEVDVAGAGAGELGHVFVFVGHGGWWCQWVK